MLYMNKKLRGLGYSELRKQRAAIPQSWHIVAKDLFRHSAAFHPLLYAGGRNEHFAEKQPDALSR